MYFNINTCGDLNGGRVQESLAALFCSNNFYKYINIYSLQQQKERLNRFPFCNSFGLWQNKRNSINNKGFFWPRDGAQTPFLKSFVEIKDHRRWEKDKNFSWSSEADRDCLLLSRLIRQIFALTLGHMFLLLVCPFFLFFFLYQHSAKIQNEQSNSWSTTENPWGIG